MRLSSVNVIMTHEMEKLMSPSPRSHCCREQGTTATTTTTTVSTVNHGSGDSSSRLRTTRQKLKIKLCRTDNSNHDPASTSGGFLPFVSNDDNENDNDGEEREDEEEEQDNELHRPRDTMTIPPHEISSCTQSKMAEHTSFLSLSSSSCSSLSSSTTLEPDPTREGSNFATLPECVHRHWTRLTSRRQARRRRRRQRPKEIEREGWELTPPPSPYCEPQHDGDQDPDLENSVSIPQSMASTSWRTLTPTVQFRLIEDRYIWCPVGSSSAVSPDTLPTATATAIDLTLHGDEQQQEGEEEEEEEEEEESLTSRILFFKSLQHSLKTAEFWNEILPSGSRSGSSPEAWAAWFALECAREVADEEEEDAAAAAAAAAARKEGGDGPVGQEKKEETKKRDWAQRWRRLRGRRKGILKKNGNGQRDRCATSRKEVAWGVDKVFVIPAEVRVGYRSTNANASQVEKPKLGRD